VRLCSWCAVPFGPAASDDASSRGGFREGQMSSHLLSHWGSLLCQQRGLRDGQKATCNLGSCLVICLVGLSTSAHSGVLSLGTGALHSVPSIHPSFHHADGAHATGYIISCNTGNEDKDHHELPHKLISARPHSSRRTTLRTRKDMPHTPFPSLDSLPHSSAAVFHEPVV